MSSPREGGIEVMGRAGRYNDEISHTRPRAAHSSSSRPHGSPLHTRKPSSSVQAAAGGESSRAPARGRLQHPEGGRRTARMKTRVITLLLAAGPACRGRAHGAEHPCLRADADGLRRARRRHGRAGAGGRAGRLHAGRHPAARRAGAHAHHAHDSDVPTTPTTPTAPPPLPDRTTPRRPLTVAAAAAGPTSGGGSPQENTNSGTRVRPTGRASSSAKWTVERGMRSRARSAAAAARRSATSTAPPRASNPGFIDALPGPSTATGVPNFIIRKFRVPPFLLRSTRQPASSTASAGRSLRRSTRSRRTTAAT